MLNRFIFCTVIAAMLAGPVTAQTDQFADADKNGDGKITRQEFLEARAARFDSIDTNKDGKLSRDEFVAAAPNFRARMLASSTFSNFDKNSDGTLSRDEFKNGPTPGFDYADTNGDGVLTADEVAAARQ
jgi:Ca2+-binding EF-hand superfamily protein